MSEQELTTPESGGVIDPALYAGMTGDELDAGEESSPYIQIIQGLSASELKEQYGEGSVLLQPAGIQLCDKDGSFTGVPVYQWISWQKVRDVNDPSGEHFIAEETYDPQHMIALRAEDWPDRLTKETKYGGRTEAYGDGLEYEYQKVIHVACLFDGEPGIVAFRKGGFKDGRALYNRLRKLKKDGQTMPIFAYTVKFSVKAVPTPSGKSKNYFLTGAIGELTDESDWPQYGATYQDIKAGHEERKAQVG